MDKKPLGKVQKLTSKELEELSKVTEEDISKAKKLWRETVPDDFIDLLDAQKVTE